MSNINKKIAMSADLHKRLAGELDAFHTNVFARAAQGQRIGSTNLSSFDGRVSLEKSRQRVRSYRDSHIGTTNGSLHSERGSIRQASESARIDLPKPTNAHTQRFTEPNGRSYNPFAWAVTSVYAIIQGVLANIAQLVRAPGCGSGGRGFNSHYSPQIKSKTRWSYF